MGAMAWHLGPWYPVGMSYNPQSKPAPDLSDIPDDVRGALKKYRSWGGAMKAGDAQALDLLLSHLDRTGRAQGTEKEEELHLALRKGAPFISPEVADVLMAHGAKVGLVLEGHDAVQAAQAARNEGLLKHFLENGHAQVDHVESDGTSLLMAALMAEQYDLADYLVERGADVNLPRTTMLGGGDTALHLAARQASFQSVVWLIEHGADPSLENSWGKQPCEEVPTLDDESAGQWDMDAMFEALEEYKVARREGRPFEIPMRLREMAHLEATPMSQAEAMMAALEAKARSESGGGDLGLIPKKKKVGF